MVSQLEAPLAEAIGKPVGGPFGWLEAPLAEAPLAEAEPIPITDMPIFTDILQFFRTGKKEQKIT